MDLPTDAAARDLFPESVYFDTCDSVLDLQHASLCEDWDCGSNACVIIKKSDQHFSHCFDHFCDQCEHFFNLVTRHAMDCQRTPCPMFLCDIIAPFQMYMSLGAFPEENRKYSSLTEKIVSYIRRSESSIRKEKQMLPNEPSAFSDCMHPRNVPSTSRDVLQYQGGTEQRNKRFKEEKN
ncbi:hypothetical protein TNCT_144971 [Trichonephila clavata]|uniref:TAZ-type domain-containing protein n=1 Tax=Trichonephila clavata TaxID=2740835 RepID=A0A8X6F032_TRICU|nr:hypothetical protein TNCT_144971 [Trichonephila clavata]